MIVSYRVYESPLDYPGKYVVRKCENYVPTRHVELADTLEQARAKIPQGMRCILNGARDATGLVEVWR